MRHRWGKPSQRRQWKSPAPGEYFPRCGMGRGISSNGRALALHVRGSGIDARILHCPLSFGVKGVFSPKVNAAALLRQVPTRYRALTMGPDCPFAMQI